MVQRIREIFTFSNNNDKNAKIHFRRLRRTRASKKLWLLALMAIALGYLFFILKSNI